MRRWMTLAVVGLSAVFSLTVGEGMADAPRCFGAAARDPERTPCQNPSLRLSVEPAPDDALLDPSAPCTPLRGVTPRACTFGVAAGQARARFALVGDSHAAHWRAALSVVARTRRWHGISIDRPQCPFTAATSALAEPDFSDCERWKRSVHGWFKRHPEVHTVFVSHNSGAGVRPVAGQSRFATKVAGYTAAWNELPASVERVIVIRDVPHVFYSTPACVTRAVERRREPGRACAVPRERALVDDPALAAATSGVAPRLHAIDLSDFTCDSRRCYPVVGGVLVNRDRGHMTRAFSTTLGPFLNRAIDRLLRTRP